MTVNNTSIFFANLGHLLLIEGRLENEAPERKTEAWSIQNSKAKHLKVENETQNSKTKRPEALFLGFFHRNLFMLVRHKKFKFFPSRTLTSPVIVYGSFTRLLNTQKVTKERGNKYVPRGHLNEQYLTFGCSFESFQVLGASRFCLRFLVPRSPCQFEKDWPPLNRSSSIQASHGNLVNQYLSY